LGTQRLQHSGVSYIRHRLKQQMKWGNNSDKRKGRSDDSATTMFAKYKQSDSGQVLSNLVGWGGLCGGPYEAADSYVGGYRLIHG
jgi:hypothetical protein